MSSRVYNFSAGPAMLPLPVLEEAQRDLLALPDVGMSVLEISHRSGTFTSILEETESNIRTLLKIPDNYKILFLQGGARLQFSMIPINFLKGTGKSADYVLTGSWGSHAFKDAQIEGPVQTAWDGKPDKFIRTPEQDELVFDPYAAYAHITSNETIQGVQFHYIPDTGKVPLIADMSSDFLSRELQIEKFGMVYACAQKNAGPAGVTIVIVRDDLLENIPENLPPILDYRTHVKAKSAYNTSPVFPIYIVMLVTRWLLQQGSLKEVDAKNKSKAALLYEAIDNSNGFYKAHAKTTSRSSMNVTWTLKNPELDSVFIAEARDKGLCELKGHRSVGGFRASIYNAMPVEGVKALRDLLSEFQKKNS